MFGWGCRMVSGYKLTDLLCIQKGERNTISSIGSSDRIKEPEKFRKWVIVAIALEVLAAGAFIAWLYSRNVEQNPRKLAPTIEMLHMLDEPDNKDEKKQPPYYEQPDLVVCESDLEKMADAGYSKPAEETRRKTKEYELSRMVVQSAVQYKQKSQPTDSKTQIKRQEVPYYSLIEKYTKQNGLDVTLTIKQIKQESLFDPNAVSPAGAVGLMQILPNTAKEMLAKLGEGRYPRWNKKETWGDVALGADLTDPETSIKLGTAYMKYLLDRFKGDKVKAYAAYNCGPGNADGWQEIEETRDYVNKILGI